MTPPLDAPLGEEAPTQPSEPTSPESSSAKQRAKKVAAREIRKSVIERSPEAVKSSVQPARLRLPSVVGDKVADDDNKEKEEVKESLMDEKTFRILSLGDSYTVGESLPESQNFPNEVARLLSASRTVGVEVVAKTGWTTDELLQGMSESEVCSQPKIYDLVTLLIGVNNQYRGRSSSEYATDFEVLLKKALEFAGGNPKKVVVLSIPDWGITPFAKDRNRGQIADQIDEFNTINYQLSKKYRALYINITPWTREAENDLTLLADDGLHPSGKEYARWAESIVALVLNLEKKTKSKKPKGGFESCILDVGNFFRKLFEGV